MCAVLGLVLDPLILAISGEFMGGTPSFREDGGCSKFYSRL